MSASTASHDTGCLLCGDELLYDAHQAELPCELCGRHMPSTARCPRGHFVCDACHGVSGRDLIERRCATTDEIDPIALATELMRSPTVSMHGPEHHFLVPAVLLATYDNVHGLAPRRARDVAEARRRADRVPGGFCGTHGNCGAAVGSGIFWSVATGATPLTEASWAQSNVMTARSLLRIAEHGGPRCCKRDTYHALLESLRELERLQPEIRWPQPRLPVCEHSHRNRQCLGERCVFHPPGSTK